MRYSRTDLFSRSSAVKAPSGVEIIPVNGDVSSGNGSAAADAQKKNSGSAVSSPDAGTGKGSKLESALDKLGFNKRKVLIIDVNSCH